MSISAIHSGFVRPLAESGKTAGAPNAPRPEKEGQSRPSAPKRDTYTPEEKEEPSGRYWMGRDENGQPKIHFDAPEQPAADSREDLSPAHDSEKKPERPASKEDGKKTEVCVCDTDKVDREIEKLKKKQEELKQQLGSETNEENVQALKKKVAQVEGELAQKDNDAYRRQHAQFS